MNYTYDFFTNIFTTHKNNNALEMMPTCKELLFKLPQKDYSIDSNTLNNCHDTIHNDINNGINDHNYMHWKEEIYFDDVDYLVIKDNKKYCVLPKPIMKLIMSYVYK